jgi:hypothetical protein
MMKVTYQKRDGSILERYRNTTPPYRIGDYTSMGWKLLNIEYCYKDKLYTEIEYYKMIEKRKQNYLKKKQIKEIIVKYIISLLYYIIGLLIINLIIY